MNFLILLTIFASQISCSSTEALKLDINKVDRIEKYALNETVLSDTIAGQLKTVQKLELLMAQKKYDEAILLFSQRQQKKINELKNEPEMFEFWCLAWTLDKAKYDRYIKRIKAGKGIFVFEDNEWKIDEK